MRAATLFTALFAMGAIAKPMDHKHHHNKRAVVVETDWDVVVDTVWVTDIVTVEPGAPATTQVAAAGVTQLGHKKKPFPKKPAPQPVETQAPAPAPAPVAAVAKPAPAPAAPKAQSGLSDYQQAVINHHNVHRRNHSAPDIQWSDELAQIAEAEANICIYAHNVTGGGGGYGQNIAAGVPASNVSEVITGLFYNGEVAAYAPYYGLANPNFDSFDSFGHFTQIVWKSTTHVACHTTDCSSVGLGDTSSDIPAFFTVCNYKGPGNMGGEYGENVGEPLNQPTVEWNYGGHF